MKRASPAFLVFCFALIAIATLFAPPPSKQRTRDVLGAPVSHTVAGDFALVSAATLAIDHAVTAIGDSGEVIHARDVETAVVPAVDFEHVGSYSTMRPAGLESCTNFVVGSSLSERCSVEDTKTEGVHLGNGSRPLRGLIA